ncbi:hypothetical protein QVD17_35117 [Tagetes erecta]|uniref:Neprosin PEP catalytic domain-containing protein n=1 Tax=Tagetes erecta TaxID=13708 RepID=A0AAD8JYT7_TARER|nr:hypothetical protein QVD17_35117 [Tagetes erecta]
MQDKRSILVKMTKSSLFFGFMVILCLFTAIPFSYAGRSGIMKPSNRMNKSPVKSIKSPDGDIIDCVNIYHQPSFDHPLLKNHTLKMKPNFYPNGEDGSNVGHKPLAQLWHSVGRCPKGTIPIRRANENDLRHREKKNFFATRQNSSFDSQLSGGNNHEYAVISATGKYFGAQGVFNIWNPMTNYNEMTIGQLWLVAVPIAQTIEVGWQVYPQKYGSSDTRLFIYSTSDGYNHVKCYNLECAENGFFQNNFDIVLGGSLAPTSQIDGAQYEMKIVVWKDGMDGEWWLQVNGHTLGYWPSKLFTYLNDGTSGVQWGGEVAPASVSGDPHTTTQMGSGAFPDRGYMEASYIKNLQILDHPTPAKYRNPDVLQSIVTDRNCYDIKVGADDRPDWDTYIFFGGPGYSDQCQWKP